MKLRIKYTKTGVLRFIGHLDVMRFFQKAIRRAKLDVSYTKGFSPHQIISFAAPMPLGMTSEGEYFDGEFCSVTSTEDMMQRLNSVMPKEIQVLDIVELPKDAKNSMAVVSASDYYIRQNEESDNPILEQLSAEGMLMSFYAQDTIQIVKRTKSSESLSDIKPMIIDIKSYKDGIYMLLASGSRENLKPELVLEAFCDFAGLPYDRYDYMIHRLETYMGEPDNLKPLSAAGKRF